jgi:large subunit ribosomal protein L32
MAVPKKRTGHSAQGKRRSNWKATKPTLTTCPNCGQAVLAHTVCTACGTYKGKPVRLKDQAAAAEKEVKPAKKTTAKKSTKKAKAEAPEKETKTEAVVEAKEETKTEEVKEEKTEETSEEKAE